MRVSCVRAPKGCPLIAKKTRTVPTEAGQKSRDVVRRPVYRKKRGRCFFFVFFFSTIRARTVRRTPYSHHPRIPCERERWRPSRVSVVSSEIHHKTDQKKKLTKITSRCKRDPIARRGNYRETASHPRKRNRFQIARNA